MRVSETMTHWFVRMFVTRVRQLGSEIRKARHLVIIAFAHVQTFDHCIRVGKARYNQSCQS